MNRVIGIVGMIILFPALCSTILYAVIIKKRGILCLPAFASIFWFVLSIFRTIKGDWNISIIESFPDFGIRTGVKYCSIFIVIGILAVLVLKILFERYGNKILNWDKMCIGAAYITMTFSYLWNGKVLNITGLIGTLVFLFLCICEALKKECIVYGNWKDNIFNVVLITGFLGVLVQFFLPNQLFLSNVNEFKYIYYDFALKTLLGTLVFIVFESILFFTLPKKLGEMYITILFSIGLLGYIQANFLNGKMIVLDGRAQSWTSVQMVINAVIWMVIIVAFIIGTIKLKERMIKVQGGISAFILGIMCFTIIVMSFTTKQVEERYILTDENIMAVNKDNNVIVFVLDWYDEQIIERIVENDPEFLEPLDGFTWYRNHTSRYAYTSEAIPYLLTGVEWKKGETEVEYAKRSYENSSFLETIYENGYDIDIYTDPVLVKESENIIDNYEGENGRKCKFLPTVQLMNQCSKYKIAPFFLKGNYAYDSSDITNSLVTEGEFANRNGRFLTMLKEDGLNEKYDTKGSFRFYHLNGVHDLIFDENMEDVEWDGTDVFNCGIGTFKVVYEYLNQMKQLGIYDSSTIIITADHGENHLPYQAYLRDLENTSNPILFVKPVNSSEFNISDAPVSQDEFQASVLSYMGIDYSEYGRRYEDVPADENRVRTMEHFIVDKSSYFKFTIDGKATDISSWSYIEEKDWDKIRSGD